MQCVVSGNNERGYVATRVEITESGSLFIVDETPLPADQFVQWVADYESTDGPRWIWSDTSVVYAELVAHGVRVGKAHDLRLSRTLLRNNRWINHAAFMPTEPVARQEADSWNSLPARTSNALFEDTPAVLENPVEEFSRQLAALATGSDGARKRLNYLMAAESAGALIAVEMTFAGVPWSAEIHNDILVEALGPRPILGARPAKLEDLAVQIRELLDAPALNPDSPKELLKALRSAGMDVKSTAKWEIRDHKHPVVPVLLRYKKLHRIMTANGWTWMDEWVRNGRFRPVYVPGGVVTGRWGADGGGALQLPHFVRPSVVADPGWCFVIADAAQLEPRILAAMSGDSAMAQAGKGLDMYQGIADAGVVDSREHAKFGMLGAMYGGTTGVSAQVLPKFKVAFPRAMKLVEDAARAGENGGTVNTWLGRTSLPGYFGNTVEGDDPSLASDRRTRARSYGRFTRNFICQGTAAEWALLWMAGVRQQLRALSVAEGLIVGNERENPHPITAGPHLVFFLHDEILIHTPQEYAQQVVDIVHEAAREAGKTLFGDTAVEFPISAAINTSYANPKIQPRAD